MIPEYAMEEVWLKPERFDELFNVDCSAKTDLLDTPEGITAIKTILHRYWPRRPAVITAHYVSKQQMGKARRGFMVSVVEIDDKPDISAEGSDPP